MFDFDAGKLLIIGVVALIVIGPKELPRVLRQVGQTVGRLKRMASEFQGQFMDAMKEADVQSIREEVAALSAKANLDMQFDPAREIQSELTRSIEAPSAALSPALAELPAASTDNFVLPSLEVATAEHAPDDSATTVAAAGSAPDAAVVEIAPAPAPTGSIDTPVAARKRKIVLPKRQPTALHPHDVSDRTGRRPVAFRVRRFEVSQR